MQVRAPSHRPTAFLCAAALLAVLATPGSSHAGDAYYLLMFGSQRIPNNPNYSHTFATFVHVTWPGDGPCPPTACLQADTISWLPSNLVIRIQALCPEPGQNFNLHESIHFALATNQRVSLWGPYQIQPELYARALRRKAVLESGTVLYKADDSFRRDDRVTNCIHAVSAISEGRRLVVASPGWGEMASYAVLGELLPWVINLDCPHYWVASALGLDAYPIIYRDRVSPRSGAFGGPIFRLFGGERNLQATYGPPR